MLLAKDLLFLLLIDSSYSICKQKFESDTNLYNIIEIGDFEMINEYKFRLKKNGEPYTRCFCRHPELIENYDKAISDTTQTWVCHHRREELYSQKELIERGEYFDVPPEELIFLTQAEHGRIDSFCKRTSEANKNRKDLSKKVLCVETGEVFESIVDAERKTGARHGHISKVCLGRKKYKTAGGFHWKYV